MPHLNADALINDPEGLAFLRGVLDAGGEPALMRAAPFGLQPDATASARVNAAATLATGARERLATAAPEPQPVAAPVEAFA